VKKTAVVVDRLVGITVKTDLDRLRAQRTLTDTLAIDGLASHPEVEIDDNLGVDDILQLLQGLLELHRIVFNLYELEGYSHDEIGRMMGIPTSSSRVYLTKAKQGLRALYIKYFGGRHDG